jgi:hypothetical protein
MTPGILAWATLRKDFMSVQVKEAVGEVGLMWGETLGILFRMHVIDTLF